MSQPHTGELHPSGDPTGTTDSANIQALLNLTGLAQLGRGAYTIASPSALTATGSAVKGAGRGTILTLAAGFSGAAAFIAQANSCEITGLSILGPAPTVADNPAANGIELAGGYRHCRFADLFFQYLNGYVIESVGGSSSANLDTMIDSVVGRSCAGGIHLQGVSGSSFGGEHFLSNIQLQRIGGGSGSITDAMLIEDVQDVLLVNYNGSVLGGSNAGITLHVKGACSSVYCGNIDIGMIALGTVSPTLLVESSSNGSPSGIGFGGGASAGGVVQAGNVGVEVAAGTDIGFRALKIKRSNLCGAYLTGGDQVVIDSCNFATNNQSGGTGYDVEISSSTGFFYFRNSLFASPIASGTSGSVPRSVNDVNHRGHFFNCGFTGSNATPSTAFNGTPQIVRGCTGYNPRGSITAPAIGTSPATISASQNDVTIIFTAINGMTAFAIGGQSVPVPPVSSPFRVPARQTVTITWTTTAPTWQWIAD